MGTRAAENYGHHRILGAGLEPLTSTVTCWVLYQLSYPRPDLNHISTLLIYTRELTTICLYTLHNY